MTIVLAIILVALASVNYYRYRDPLYPAFVQSALWALLTVLLAAFETTHWPLNSLSVTTYGLGALLFTAGCTIATLGFEPVLERRRVLDTASAMAPKVLIVIAILLLPLFATRVMSIIAQGPTGFAIYDVRWMVNHGGETLGLGVYGTPIAFLGAFSALVPLLRDGYTRADVLTFVTGAGVALLYALMSTGRTWLFLLILTLCTAPIAIRIWRPARAGSYLLGSLVALFLFMHILLQSQVHTGGFGALFIESVEQFMHYLMGGAYAYDTLLETPSPLEMGANTGRFFYAIGEALGFNIEAKPLVQDFSYPFNTNVYSVYQPYFLDFGITAAVLVQGVFGVIHGALYRLAMRAEVREWHLFIFALSFYPLFMQFFQDQYLSLTSIWLQFAFLGMAYYGSRAFIERRSEANIAYPLYGYR